MVIGDNCHISTSSTINGNSKIGKNSFIGSGSIVVNNIEIGESKFIKAGSGGKEELKMKIKVSQMFIYPDETVINVLKKLNETGEDVSS